MSKKNTIYHPIYKKLSELMEELGIISDPFYGDVIIKLRNSEISHIEKRESINLKEEEVA